MNFGFGKKARICGYGSSTKRLGRGGGESSYSLMGSGTVSRSGALPSPEARCSTADTLPTAARRRGPESREGMNGAGPWTKGPVRLE